MHPKIAKIIAAVVLFASGAVVGIAGSRLLGERGPLAIMHGDPRHFAAMAMRRLTSDLDLSQEQQDKLRPIIMDTTRQIIALRREQEPRMKELINTSIELTKALLTPEQREKFADVMARLEARRKVLDRLGPPPMEGPMPPPPSEGFGPHGSLPPPPPPDLLDPEWDLPPPPGFGPPPPGFGPPPRRDVWPEKTPRPDGAAKPADKAVPGIDVAPDDNAGPGGLPPASELPPQADPQGRTPPKSGDAPAK